MEKIGVILKSLREKLGYSQDSIANFLGIKREMVSYYETGKRDIPIDILERLSDIFGVELEVFFSGSLEEAQTDIAFAFRADGLTQKDMEGIAAFRKIIKNYERMLRLEKENA